MTKMKDASGEKRYYYDDADRLTKVEQGPIGFGVGLDHNYVLEYAWNAASQLTQMKLTIRTQSAKTWDYAYLDDGEMDTVTNPDSDVTDHQYLTDGRLKKIVLDSTATRELFYQDTNDSHAYVTGKNSHLRKTLDKTSVGLTISSFAYELDAAGIRRSITDKAGKYRAFGYDPKYQLKAEIFWTAKAPGTRTDALLWNYDGNGNRLTQHDSGVLTDYVYGDNNQMTDAGTEDFTYDHFGNTASIVNQQAFTYNFDNCMTLRESLMTENFDTHEYDGNMRRMRSKLNDAAHWTNFIHDELTGNLICEYTLISGTFTIKALNTYGLGLISTNREGTIRYFHFDGLGSAAALTDIAQNITDSYTYDAFGNPLSAAGSSVNPYRYVGQWGYYNDGAMGSSSGMLLLGVRYYWPKYGRFSTWDVIGSSNTYLYALSSPSTFIDPNGNIAIAAPIVIEILIFVGIALLAANAARNIDCDFDLPTFPSPPKGPVPAPPPSGARPDTARPYPRVIPIPYAKPKPRLREDDCSRSRDACNRRPRHLEDRGRNFCRICESICRSSGSWPSSDYRCQYWRWGPEASSHIPLEPRGRREI